MKKHTMELISENDDVFILKGEEEDELYLVDDPSIIAILEAKINELKGMDETEMIKYLLPIVNPEKYNHGKK